MFLINLALQTGLLWFFISSFTRSTDSSESGRQALIVIAILFAANLILAFTLRPLIGNLTVGISVVILYFAVSFICQTPRRTTLWITGAYFVTTLLLGWVFSMLAS